MTNPLQPIDTLQIGVSPKLEIFVPVASLALHSTRTPRSLRETTLHLEGRTRFHAPEIDGKVYINDFGDLQSPEPGRFYRAEITEAHDYDLVARIVSSEIR